VGRAGGGGALAAHSEWTADTASNPGDSSGRIFLRRRSPPWPISTGVRALTAVSSLTVAKKTPTAVSADCEAPTFLDQRGPREPCGVASMERLRALSGHFSLCGRHLCSDGTLLTRAKFRKHRIRRRVGHWMVGDYTAFHQNIDLTSSKLSRSRRPGLSCRASQYQVNDAHKSHHTA